VFVNGDDKVEPTIASSGSIEAGDDDEDAVDVTLDDEDEGTDEDGSRSE
jgi:hypothetical protein